MAKHNANVDVRGDLRVQGFVEDNLRVRDEVEAAAFYIRGVGEIVSGGGGGVTDHGALTGLADDDHSQYILVSGARAFTAAQSMGGNKLTNLGVPVAPSDAARLQDIDPGFYGITVVQSDDEQSFSGINTIKFESANFYITQNDPNTDEVQINFRGIASNEITINDGVRTFVSDTGMFSVSGDDFYLSKNSSGKPTINLANKFSGALIMKDQTTQTVENGATSIIEWDTVVYDFGGWTDLGSDNTIFTVPANVSLVQVYGNLEWANYTPSGNSGRFLTSIRKNGSFEIPGLPSVEQAEPVESWSARYNASSAPIFVKEGDTFDFRSAQNSGQTQTVNGTERSWFAIRAIDL